MSNIEKLDYQETLVALLHMMDEAAKHVKYPEFKLNGGFTLKRIGEKSQHKGGINITDGRPYGKAEWYGRINKNATFNCSAYWNEDDKLEPLETEMENFIANRYEYALHFSEQNHSTCMFCQKNLIHKISVAVGFGPTCAKTYGLAWCIEEEKELIARTPWKVQYERPAFLSTHEMLLVTAESWLGRSSYEELCDKLALCQNDIGITRRTIVVAMYNLVVEQSQEGEKQNVQT